MNRLLIGSQSAMLRHPQYLTYPAARQASSGSPSSAQPESLYAQLGLSPHATQTEIKATFAKISQISPDQSSDPEIRGRFVKITEAYSILGNASLRRNYDRSLLVPKSGVPFSQTKEASTAAKKVETIASTPASFSAPEKMETPVAFRFASAKVGEEYGDSIRREMEMDRQNGLPKGAGYCFGAILLISIMGISINLLTE